MVKLPGYYIFTKNKLVIPLDIFKVENTEKDKGRTQSEFDIDVRASGNLANSLTSETNRPM